jgi:preprotein translocase subunit YajC
MGAEAQEGFKDTVEKAKENFEKFVDNISRYDEVITDLIPGLAADIQEAIDEQIDIQIEEFDMEIEIRLDLAEAERD